MTSNLAYFKGALCLVHAKILSGAEAQGTQFQDPGSQGGGGALTQAARLHAERST